MAENTGSPKRLAEGQSAGQKIHRSAHREQQMARDDAFIDGVCHAIDELRALGHFEAAEALFARMFAPAVDVSKAVRL
jgi:hypothetical protein